MSVNCNLAGMCKDVGSKYCKYCKEYNSLNPIAYNNVVIVKVLVKMLTEMEKINEHLGQR